MVYLLQIKQQLVKRTLSTENGFNKSGYKNVFGFN